MKPFNTLMLTMIATLTLTACGSKNETNTASKDAQETSTVQEPVWDGNTVVLETQKLADGIFAVIPVGATQMAEKGEPIATSGGFIVGDDGVLVIESMLNKRLAEQMVGLIRAETNAPIRYLVNTSFHGDHSYGNYVFDDNVEIIQHEKAKAYVDQYIEQDKAFMIQNFGAGRGIEEAIPTTGDRLIKDKGEIEIDLGGQVIKIRDFGFAQTGGDLFIWHPEAKVLWTGNAVVAQAPALPWLLDGHFLETRDTLRAVYHAMPQDARIVPGHGPVTDRAAIKWNVDYLNEVEVQVHAAIKDGLTLEQTTARVNMPDFEGYALWGWVHQGLNIKAAYDELSQEQ